MCIKTALNIVLFGASKIAPLEGAVSESIFKNFVLIYHAKSA